MQQAILVAGQLDAEALGHPRVEGGEGLHRPHEDGKVGDPALLVEAYHHVEQPLGLLRWGSEHFRSESVDDFVGEG